MVWLRGAMLDNGKLSPGDIAPICTVWWLPEENIINKRAVRDDGGMANLSSRRRVVCVASNEWDVAVSRLERTGTNAFPDINTPSFRVPDATLGVHVPVDVELPDTRCVADDSWHVVGQLG